MIIETLTLLGLTATQLGYAALSMIGVFTVIFYLIALDRAGASWRAASEILAASTGE